MNKELEKAISVINEAIEEIEDSDKAMYLSSKLEDISKYFTKKAHRFCFNLEFDSNEEVDVEEIQMVIANSIKKAFPGDVEVVGSDYYGEVDIEH